MRLIVMITLAAFFVAVTSLSAAPLSYSGGAYNQNFDGLPSAADSASSPPNTSIAGRGPIDVNGQLGTTEMGGWTMSNPSDLLGTTNAVEFRAHNGSLSGGAGRGVVSFGTDGSGERALGELPTSNQINRFGVAFTNSTGKTLNSFSLSFTGEQWRRGDVTAPVTGQNTLKFDYAVRSNALDNIDTAEIFTNIGTFSSPHTTDTNTALDGNLAANQVPVAVVLNNINWTPNATLMLRWSAFQDSGQDDGLAIDNLSFSARVPEPATVFMIVMAAFGVAMLRKRH